MTEPPTWDVKQLRDDVQAVYGTERRLVVERSITSMDQRLQFARYHYQEQKRLMAGVVMADARPLDHVMLALGGQGEEGHAFRQARQHAMAHVVACVSSMHAVADTLAFAIYHVLAMDLDAQSQMTERRISVHSVAKRVREPAIHLALTELAEHDGFRYLNALTNHSKHRAMIRVGYRAEFDPKPDAQSHGLSFEAFEHEGVAYSGRWVTPTLNAEYDRQQPLIQAIGRALNSAVAALRT